MDLQKLVLRRLLETSDTDLYSKTSSKYFTGANLDVYGKISRFYRDNLRLPNPDELLAIKKEISLQDYIETQILSDDNKNDNIRNEFLLQQLQDYSIRDETIYFVDTILDELEDLEGSEIVDKIQNFLLEINRNMPIGEELMNVANLELSPKQDSFVLYPSGLSHEYDSENGGFALQELVMIGGRRGSGKSIIALNAAIQRFLQGSTTAFFSIEMRYLEVYYRLLAALSEVPFLSFMRNQLTKEQKVEVARTKAKLFYEENEDINKWLLDLEKTGNLAEFDNKMSVKKPPKKPNQFLIIDDPSLTLNRIDHYCNMFTNKYENFTMATVDYINIIKAEDSKDWQMQITMAEALKQYARKYNITMLTPYQVDQTLEARFAKGILDSADRSFTFAPRDTEAESQHITMYTSKIRNGKNMTFDVGMNWACTKVDPNMLTPPNIANTRLLKGAQYGTGTAERSKENASDL